MAIQESGEMYLENIFILKKNNKTVRAVDVANFCGYSKPSVSRALGILKKNGLLDVEDGGSVNLTQDGEKLARAIYERHNVLSEFLMYLGIDRTTATEDACKIEHVISNATFEKIKSFVMRNK